LTKKNSDFEIGAYPESSDIISELLNKLCLEHLGESPRIDCIFEKWKTVAEARFTKFDGIFQTNIPSNQITKESEKSKVTSFDVDPNLNPILYFKPHAYLLPQQYLSQDLHFISLFFYKLSIRT